MVDMSTISAALTSLNAASKFIKDSIEKIKDNAVREKVEELLNAIIPLQTHVITLQAMNSESIKEKEALEKKLKEIEDWSEESSRYELKELAPRVYVYTIKADSSYVGPIHNLCTNCFDIHHKKSIIQLLSETAGGIFYFCPNCKTELKVHHGSSGSSSPNRGGGGPHSWMGA